MSAELVFREGGMQDWGLPCDHFFDFFDEPGGVILRPTLLATS